VEITTDDDVRAPTGPGSTWRAGWLDHGYATTIHKSQGETVERAFVLGTAGGYREAAYVAMSRARLRSDLYVVEGAFETGVEPSATPVRLAVAGTEAVSSVAGQGTGPRCSVSNAATPSGDELHGAEVDADAQALVDTEGRRRPKERRGTPKRSRGARSMR
jgi:hypothetical protein